MLVSAATVFDIGAVAPHVAPRVLLACQAARPWGGGEECTAEEDRPVKVGVFKSVARRYRSYLRDGQVNAGAAVGHGGRCALGKLNLSSANGTPLRDDVIPPHTY